MSGFPVSEYLLEHVLDGETVARGGGWWTAVLLIRDPKSEEPFIAMYRWQSGENGWKVRKQMSLKSRAQVETVCRVMTHFAQRLPED